MNTVLRAMEISGWWWCDLAPETVTRRHRTRQTPSAAIAFAGQRSVVARGEIHSKCYAADTRSLKPHFHAHVARNPLVRTMPHPHPHRHASQLLSARGLGNSGGLGGSGVESLEKYGVRAGVSLVGWCYRPGIDSWQV